MIGRAFLIALFLLLGGCVRTVGTIVTAPVKVVSQGADWATTSRDEADRNRGREIRKQEEREARERRRREREQQDYR
jgi:hypothetical protein